jgi:hypothetical protein
VIELEDYYVVGAEQKNGLYKDWEQYKKGLIIKVSPKQNRAEKCIEYISPPEVIPDERPSISFTAGTIENNHLYVGTQTELLVYTLPDFQKVGYLTYPCFNDIHHVRPTSKGNLLVVNTGLDMVLEVSKTGEFLNEWHVFGENLWKRFSRKMDYRKVPTTKPHQSHPNYVFQIGEDIWVTRCLQKDAICLTKPNKQIQIGEEKVHDGVVVGNLIYFTQVTGRVVIVDIHTLKVKQVFNLNNMTNTSQPLGWCRGIKVLDDYTVIVGFTRVRPSKKLKADGTFRWEGQYGVLPTRISCYDLKHGKQLWEQQLEDHDMNAIYSIHSV